MAFPASRSSVTSVVRRATTGWAARTTARDLLVRAGGLVVSEARSARDLHDRLLGPRARRRFLAAGGMLVEPRADALAAAMAGAGGPQPRFLDREPRLPFHGKP